MMQETKTQPGSIQFDGFVTYEHARTCKEGGGVSISAVKELKPCLIRDGRENIEALTVRIHLKKIIISMNTAYGPQEYAKIEKKKEFWNYLSEEAQRAKNDGHGFILQGDWNARLGPEILPSDTKPANSNGKMLSEFVNSNRLIIVNTLDICKGSTTWSKIREGKELKSTIDFFVVCECVLPFVTQMVSDNDNNHRIANFNKIKSEGTTTEADHTPMWINIDLKITPNKPEKVEIKNFKEVKAQQDFKASTDQTNDFTNCLRSNKDIDEKAELWKHLLNEHCRKSFKKIRIKKKSLKRSKADKLISEINKMLNTNKDPDSAILKELNQNISDIISVEEREKFLQFKPYETI